MKNNDNELKYIRAKERVDKLRKFYGNLTSYILVISLLAIINYWTNEWRYAWFLWAALGWGIGLLFHAISTFGLSPFLGKDWEERKIREFMQDDEQQKRWE